MWVVFDNASGLYAAPDGTLTAEPFRYSTPSLALAAVFQVLVPNQFKGWDQIDIQDDNFPLSSQIPPPSQR